MASLEQQRLQLIEDYTYIKDKYGAPDAAETHLAMWDAVTSPDFTKAKVNDVLCRAVELAFEGGVFNDGGWLDLPVDDDARLQQIKRRWHIG